MYRISRKVKDELIKYVKLYANRIIESKNKTMVINQFDSKIAATTAQNALLSNGKLSEKECDNIRSEEAYQKLIEFFDEKLIVNYFMLIRKISYYEAKSLLIDKGVDAFPETKGIQNSIYVGRYHDYKATDKQITYIELLAGAVICHKEELTGREASLIISCLLKPNKTRPAYYNYYIRAVIG